MVHEAGDIPPPSVSEARLPVTIKVTLILVAQKVVLLFIKLHAYTFAF